MKKLAFIFLFSGLVSVSMAQKLEWKEGNSYNNVKIYLDSGEILDYKKISVLKEGIQAIPKTSSDPVYYNYNQIKQIEAPSKNNFGIGALFGTGAGLVTMLIYEAAYEKPVTTTFPGGWETVTKELHILEKIPFLLGGAALGALIGLYIDSKCKIIYPVNNLSFNFSLQKNLSVNPVFSMKLRF